MSCILAFYIALSDPFAAAAARVHLRPDSTISRYFLAETLFALGRPAEARAELQGVIDAPPAPEWAPEDREFKRKAAALLARTRDTR